MRATFFTVVLIFVLYSVRLYRCADYILYSSIGVLTTLCTVILVYRLMDYIVNIINGERTRFCT